MNAVPVSLRLFALSLAACGVGAPGHLSRTVCELAGDVSQSPDTVPGWVYDPANAVRGTWITGLYARDVLVISFAAGTSARDRAAAICAVNATVVGGQRVPGLEGRYFLRLPPDPTQETMRRAVELLDALPQVQLVTPEFVDNALSGA